MKVLEHVIPNERVEEPQKCSKGTPGVVSSTLEEVVGGTMRGVRGRPETKEMSWIVVDCTIYEMIK